MESGNDQQQLNNRDADAAAIWQSEHYELYPDRVVQHEFTAQVLSGTEITSNYKSKANAFQNPRLIFKFCLNGQDNELPPGVDHQITCVAQNNTCETPLIIFGEPLKTISAPPTDTYLAPDTLWKIRLDLRPVLQAFEDQGFYETYNGEKIRQEDFKGVFVAGSTAPLTWDFANLINRKELELKEQDNSGIYEVTLLLNPDTADKAANTTWQLSRDIAAFPQYTSGYPLVDALYKLALEEMLNAIEEDHTFRTGKEWAGVWTRDISYSILLSMGMLQPQVARNSLLRKVNSAYRIIQDTGTGGAYPVSSDRIVWALAAWELYLITGDDQWLQDAYQIIKNSLEDDLRNVYDPITGLFHGESSFLDWREQTYPAWMQPADIYDSKSLSTNAVFYQACCILAQMADIVKDAPAITRYQQLAAKIKKAINQHFWIPEKKYYGQFLYGRNFKILSPRADALGEALCVLFDIAEAGQQRALVANTPVTPYGIPCISPQIPHIPPYHNNAIWPFVQAYWSLAAAKASNAAALTASLCAIYRPAALLLTNQENLVASNGDYAGTQVNSSNMLWSLAGHLSMTYKVIFGINFRPDGLQFKPVVPKAFKKNHQLVNFTYRQAILDIQLEGFGNQITVCTLDDEPLPNAIIPIDLKGRHQVRIILANNAFPEQNQNQVTVDFSPVTPEVSYQAGTLAWPAVAGAEKYQVIQNGQLLQTTTATQVPVPAPAYAEFQVIAVNAQEHESFASEPLPVTATHSTQRYKLKQNGAQTNIGLNDISDSEFVEISLTKNTNLKIEVVVPEAGLYALDFWYANGEGPISTSNRCAMRTLKKDDLVLGTIVFPQRGYNNWADWGFTNAVQVKLEKGRHFFALAYETGNENMHGKINRALVDYLRITKISG
ncbi:alpha-L-rhamnosidase-related protein [Adhaeribacter pallidiroseus]|uniref:Alpha-L-rhamnosidase six-hairpin glycosidase domain-containing protein n=1 Tax=Adhaeribacter pallidiroseus TaxID=2072847 RepID=A0A369QUF2_9BACT|nr:amylo-alpha-1,6-glucosidase [Adhaeribacter pallidiroseus]RDC66429.1 hypothetical protein AHMF7616_05060 [Adhaeribacter pallidiroseus]